MEGLIAELHDIKKLRADQSKMPHFTQQGRDPHGGTTKNPVVVDNRKLYRSTFARNKDSRKRALEWAEWET